MILFCEFIEKLTSARRRLGYWVNYVTNDTKYENQFGRNDMDSSVL